MTSAGAPSFNRRVLPALAALVLLGAQAATCLADAALDSVEREQKQRTELIQRLTPTVISVFRVNKRSGQLAPGSGSGVIISPDGYALTNYHVTGSFEELRAGLPGGMILKAHLCGVDRTGDIALIKLDSPQALPCAGLGDSGQLAVGEWVLALGNPFQLATDFQPTVSLGVVSGLHRYLPGEGLLQRDLIYANAIQLDAAINPGNSGGPLFNARGQLVGINGRITPRQVRGLRLQRINAGIGFAVPIDNIKPFLDDLKAGYAVDRGYLGISKIKLRDDGLEIQAVEPDSPAEIFDLRPGDVLLRIDGTEVRDPGELQNVVHCKPAGARVKVELRRADQPREQTVQLAGVQASGILKALQLVARRGAFSSLFQKPEPKPAEAEEQPKEEAPQEPPAPQAPAPDKESE